MLRIIILFIAITAGGASAWLLLASRSRGPQPVAQAQQAPTTDVLVASAALPQGRVLAEKDLRWQAWPKDAVNPSYVTRSGKPDALTSLKGSLVRVHFVAGEPIQEEKLSRGSAGMLATMLPAGKRAVAIRVTAESTAGGFILPNDRVDVIQTVVRNGQSGEVDPIGKTILTNIRVLAIDQKADEVQGQAVFVGKTATLELGAEQAEIIAAGQATGTLSLALRSVADSNDVPAVKPRKDASIRILRAGRSETVRIQ